MLDSDTVEQNVWTVPSASFGMCFKNDERFLSGEDTPQLASVSNVSRNSMEHFQADSQDGPVDFQWPQIPAGLVLRNIDIGEELFCDDSDSYDFNSKSLQYIVRVQKSCQLRLNVMIIVTKRIYFF